MAGVFCRRGRRGVVVFCTSEEEGEWGFSVWVRKMGSGENWGATEVGESSELQYRWKRGGRRVFLGSPLFKKNGLFLAKNKNKWALRWIGFCISPVGCPCFVLEGLNTRGSPLETPPALQLIAHSKENKRRLQLNYGSSSVNVRISLFHLALVILPS